jgi:hypothetical protein
MPMCSWLPHLLGGDLFTGFGVSLGRISSPAREQAMRHTRFSKVLVVSGLLLLASASVRAQPPDFCEDLLGKVGLGTTSKPSERFDPRIGLGSHVLDLSRVRVADEKTLREIRTAGSRKLLILNENLLSDKSAKDALKNSKAHVIMKNAGDIPRLEQVLKTNVDAIRVVAVLPTTPEGVKAVFNPRGESQLVMEGDLPSVVSYMKKVKNIIGERVEIFNESRTPADHDPLNTISGNGSGMANAFMSYIKTHKIRETMCILCHNDAGSKRIFFPDGTSVKVEDVQNALQGGMGILLTCSTVNAKSPAGELAITTRDLEFDEIAKSIAIINRPGYFEAGNTFGQLLVSVNKELNAVRGPANGVVKLVVVGVVGDLITLMIVNLSHQECSCASGCDCCGLEAMKWQALGCCGGKCCGDRQSSSASSSK